MHYAKFLGRKQMLDLPYLGGPFVYAKDRRLRVEAPRPLVSGWTRFEVTGRSARAVMSPPADSVDLGHLPRVRGHHVGGFLARDSGAVERVHLWPAEEAPPLAVVRARRWHSGDLLFESLDFDTEVEEALRLRLEHGHALEAVRGVTPSLRAAFAIARALREGDAVTVTDAIRARTPKALDNPHRRAEVALDAAHARLLSSRRLSGNNLEVVFELREHEQRIVSVVDAITLHVYDAGICLAGADELLTLESLPGVVREAIETESLVITRR